ncbi:MAG: PPK2 family polyphosphate kinase [Myxococcota bacterium]
MSKHRTKIEKRNDGVRLAHVGEHPRVESKKAYHEELAELQLTLLRIQQAYHAERRRAVLVFEGWDAGGKGGAIRRMTEKLDPRAIRAHAIAAPTAEEQGRHYLYRFWQRVPSPGRIAVFDRSWYGRVLVERVEGFASKSEWKRAYAEINEFEHTLIDDGVRVAKLFLHISADEQLRRFEQRLNDPYKRWKLTSEDIRNRERWDEYESAIDEMIEKTSTVAAPWTLVPGNHKWHARLAVLRRVVDVLGEGVDADTPRVDSEVVKAARQKLGLHVEL